MGDHRCIVIDILEQILNGEQKFKNFRPQAQRLQCSRNAVKTKYNTYIIEQLVNHKKSQKLSGYVTHTMLSTNKKDTYYKNK